jgi:hypothetical protein
MSRERPRSTPAPMLRDDPGLIFKEHVTPLRSGEEWREWGEWFLRAFSPEQAAMLNEMLSKNSTAWRREWQACTNDLQNAVQNYADEVSEDLNDYRDAILKLRAQMDVIVNGSGGGLIEVPKFLGKSDGLEPARPDDRFNGIVERLADIEKLAARMERQIKEAQSRKRKAKLIAEAMMRTLTRRVAKLEGSLSQVTKDLSETTERLRGLEHGA